MGNRDMATAARGFPWSGDTETERRELTLNLGDEEIGLRQRLRAESAYAARFGDEFERAKKWRERENVRSADVQRRRAVGRFVKARHRETALWGHSPPAGQPWSEAEMPAVQIETSRSAGAGIQPLVVRPEREIDV